MFPLEQTAMREATRLFFGSHSDIRGFRHHRACGRLGSSALGARGAIRNCASPARRSDVPVLPREARERCSQFGIRDDREEVTAHWRDVGSWFVPPVIVTGEVLGINFT